MADVTQTEQALAQAGGMQVIYDSGRGVPASVYLTYLVNVDPNATGEVMAGLSFPITTRLAPGLLADARPVFDPDWQAQPVFLVGADLRSLGWLAFNRWRLMRARAWGLIVQAGNAQAFRAVQAMAPQLQFAPSLGGWLDARLLEAGAGVYPLFIGIDGVAVQILPEAVYGPADVAFGDGRSLVEEARP